MRYLAFFSYCSDTQVMQCYQPILLVILDLCKKFIVLIAYIMCLLSFLASSSRTQQALQWWFRRQSMQLSLEAEKIRDGLLQESFTMRRTLELSLLDNVEISTKKSQDCLKTIENFYHCLEQLSDRLSPAYIEDSLPLAIQWVIESWRYNPNLKFQLDLPAHWRHEQPDRSQIILRALDELLRITSSELLTEISIYVSLKLQGDVGELIVHISYPDVPTLVFYSGLKDLKYLSQTFRFLTSGQCFCRRKDLTVDWYFRWVTQENRHLS